MTFEKVKDVFHHWFAGNRDHGLWAPYRQWSEPRSFPTGHNNRFHRGLLAVRDPQSSKFCLRNSGNSTTIDVETAWHNMPRRPNCFVCLLYCTTSKKSAARRKSRANSHSCLPGVLPWQYGKPSPRSYQSLNRPCSTSQRTKR